MSEGKKERTGAGESGAKPAPREGGGAPRSAPDDAVDEASKESFPASDPPGWEPLHPGKPGRH